MARMYRCYNPECSEHPHGKPGFDFLVTTPTMPDGGPIECPKCGAENLTSVIPVHLLVKDKNGPLKTAHGRRRIVCQPKQATIKGRLTGEPAAVNCPVCLASEEYAKLKTEVRALDEHEFPEVGTKLVSEPAAAE